VKPAELALRALELLHLSPLAEWHYKTAHRDSFVDVSKAQRLLGWQPRLSNREALIADVRLVPIANRERVGAAGVTHRCRGTSKRSGSEEALVIVLSQSRCGSCSTLDALVEALAAAHKDLSEGKASMPPRIAALVREHAGAARGDAVIPAVGGARLQARDAVSAQPRPRDPPGGDLRLRPGQRHAASR
jgi:hypothetical protein